MSTTVDQAFIKQYNAEVHMAYQRMGSDFRNFVRRSTQIPGQTITFQKVGKGTARRGKTRHGNVPTMNAAHTSVDVTLIDSFAADYVDKFDLLKTNIDERRVVTETGAMALGRDTDQHIVDALVAASATNTNVNLSAITVGTLTGLVTRLGAKDVPVNSTRVAVSVSWEVWGKMLTLQEFVNSQWVGPDQLPLKTPTLQGKVWAGAIWFPTTALPKATHVRKCFAWDRMAIGHGVAAEVETDVGWIHEKHSWFVNSTMSQGAVTIDATGIEQLSVTENA
jgi:hypothetical protein